MSTLLIFTTFLSRPKLLQALIGLFELPEDDSIPDDEHFIEVEETPGQSLVIVCEFIKSAVKYLFPSISNFITSIFEGALV